MKLPKKLLNKEIKETNKNHIKTSIFNEKNKIKHKIEHRKEHISQKLTEPDNTKRPVIKIENVNVEKHKNKK